MSPRNIFLSVAGVLILIVIIIGLTAWKPFTNSFLVNPQATTTPGTDTTPSDVVVSHSTGAQTIKVGTHYVSVIRYNGDTFSPRILVITRGESVRFVNGSSLSMRIQADRTSSTTVPATYQQAQTVGKNGIYELSFENPGVWVAHNLNDQSSPNTALIYVK